jgi:hypothetical protein
MLVIVSASLQVNNTYEPLLKYDPFFPLRTITSIFIFTLGINLENCFLIHEQVVSDVPDFGPSG